MSTEFEQEVMQKAKAYCETLTTLNNPIVVIDFDDVARFDPHLSDYFFNPSSFDITKKIFDSAISLSRDDQKKEYCINFLPHKLMEGRPISMVTHQEVDKPFKFTGYVDAISGIVTTGFTKFKCSACNEPNHEPGYFVKCKHCLQVQPKGHPKHYMKSIRNFQLNEAYDYKQICESIDCEVPINTHAKKANIFDIESMLTKKLDFLAIPKLKPVGKVLIPYLKIIGIRDANTHELKEERKTEIDEYIQEHRQDMLEILRKNIFNFHKGDDQELKAMIICAIGLNPTDEQFSADMSLQMVFQWIGAVGIGKSHLMKALKKYMENSEMVGKQTSKGGITGGAEKNNSGQWVFKLGEITKCNYGCIFADEIGMWDEELQNSLSEQMSDGTLTYTKIIKSKQKLFLNYILSGNPPEGAFDPNKTVYQNMGGTHQINDRATIQIITTKSEVSKEEFSEIMDFSVNMKSHEKTLNDDFIIDLIKRIKEYPNPRYTDLTYKQAKENFEKISYIQPKDDKGYDEHSVQIKKFRIRAWQSYLKFCKSVARIKGNKEVREQDVVDAWEIIYNVSYLRLLRDYGDIDLEEFTAKESALIKQGMAKPQSTRKLVDWIYKQISKSKDGLEHIDLMTQVVEKWKINETELDKVIEMLKGNNSGSVAQIFEQPSGTYKAL